MYTPARATKAQHPSRACLHTSRLFQALQTPPAQQQHRNETFIQMLLSACEPYGALPPHPSHTIACLNLGLVPTMRSSSAAAAAASCCMDCKGGTRYAASPPDAHPALSRKNGTAVKADLLHGAAEG